MLQDLVDCAIKLWSKYMVRKDAYFFTVGRILPLIKDKSYFWVGVQSPSSYKYLFPINSGHLIESANSTKERFLTSDISLSLYELINGSVQSLPQLLILRIHFELL